MSNGHRTGNCLRFMMFIFKDFIIMKRFFHPVQPQKNVLRRKKQRAKLKSIKKFIELDQEEVNRWARLLTNKCQESTFVINPWHSINKWKIAPKTAWTHNVDYGRQTKKKKHVRRMLLQQINNSVIFNVVCYTFRKMCTWIKTIRDDYERQCHGSVRL